MNYGALVRKGDTLICNCGKQAVVSAARQLPAGWIAKAEPIKDFDD